MTFSACAYALKCLIDPDLPVNDGFYRLITVDAPSGTRDELHAGRARSSAAGRRRTALVEVIFRALLPGFPERLPAGTKGMMCQAGLRQPRRRGRDLHLLLRDVRRRLRRPVAAATAPTPCRRTARTPRTRRSRRPSSTTRSGSTRLALVEDSEGPGRFRGGLGLRKDYLFDRHDDLHDPRRPRPVRARWGAFGGHDGSVAEYVLIRDGAETRLGSKSTVELEPGDVISVRTCGGGGYGAARGARPGARPARRAARARSAPSAPATSTASPSTSRRRELDEQATAELRT